MKQASILFSGGPDSTLAVLHALERFDRVHLLTFHHSLMSQMGKHTVVARELQEKYGSDRVVTHEETINDLYRTFYFTDISKLLPRYRTFYIPWMCGACKMAMHTLAIRYDLKHGIGITYDGANRESEPYFPSQTRTYLGVLKDLYRSYGIEYDNPVFEIDSTDKETERYGLVTTKNTKQEHVYFSTQHTCYIGLLIHAHSRLYYRPFRGKQLTAKNAEKLLSYMIVRCKSFLPESESTE